VALLAASGVGGYLYALSQYTARVQYAAVLDRPRSFGLVSAAAYSPNMRYFYLACALGWLLGLLTLRGRPWVLMATAVASFVVYVGYSAVYLLLLNAVWVPPIPTYLEHSLFVLYLAGAVAGYWGVLQTVAWLPRHLVAAWRPDRAGGPGTAGPVPSLWLLFGIPGAPRSMPLRALPVVTALAFLAVIPAKVATYARYESASQAEIYHESLPNEPQLLQFLARNISSNVGQALSGSVKFWGMDHDTGFTMANAWSLGMQTIDEYSQLVTPPALYFLRTVLRNSVVGTINMFTPFPGGSWESYAKVMQLFGMRYYVSNFPRPEAGDPATTLPRDTHGEEPGVWYVYEHPRPNTGNYSPTEITTARSAAETIASIGGPDFDYTRHAVLSEPLAVRLVPARDMRLSRVRGGFHVSGKSDGTSLVVLPLQFSNCLRARDQRIRFVRADLLMAGMIFSGEVDTDIVFDYGFFLSSACRRADLAEFKQLDMRIDQRMPHLNGDRLFPGWKEAWKRLRTAAAAIQ